MNGTQYLRRIERRNASRSRYHATLTVEHLDLGTVVYHGNGRTEAMAKLNAEKYFRTTTRASYEGAG